MKNTNINRVSKIKGSDNKNIASRTIARQFGKREDYVDFYIYDMSGTLLDQEEDFKGYKLPDNNSLGENNLTTTLLVDPYASLNNKGYRSGQYSVVYNIQRTKFYPADPPTSKPFSIREISPSRTELKIDSETKGDIKLKTLSFISELEGSLFNKDFVLNFGMNQNILGINVAYDNINDCVLIKLYEPLPQNIEVGDKLKIAEEIIDPLEYVIDLGAPEELEIGIPLKGPNFRIDTRLNDSIPSQFKVYNDFLENTHSASLYNVMSHLSASVELSIDYTKTGTGSLETGYHFENFTHFGSAEERLKNFKYKLELLELYDAQLSEINTITGNIALSSTVSSNKNLIERKKADLISAFDNYERFLYYEFHPYAWPKVPDFGIGTMQVTGSTLLPESVYLQVGLNDCNIFLKPYNLYSTTSSNATEWFGSTQELNIDYGGQVLSASRFDRDNKHNLLRTIPEHISMREENASYLTFVNMVGHYFDQIWLYIDHIGQIRNAHNSPTEGISKDLVYTALSSLGLEAFDQFENEELFEYIIGTSKTKQGSFGTYEAPQGQTMVTASIVTCDNGGSSMPKGDITKEIWKRLYHNLPYLLKTKGTERGIKALMNCYGIPETILNVKEYGGPTTDSTTYKTFNYEKFSHALKGDSGTEGYFIKAPWASTSSLFTGLVNSKLEQANGKIIFSIGTEPSLFSPPYPKTVELTSTDGSTHVFDSGYDFMIEPNGLETAQSLTGAIDMHPLFSASLSIPADLYDESHEKYELDLIITITQHLAGIDGNTEIKGTLFEDNFTPACGNPQQFPLVEFLTTKAFTGGGGQNNSFSTTVTIPGTDSCSSKTLIENGKKYDGTGTLINNGAFQDEDEFITYVTTCTNGYCDKDISAFMYEAQNPSATPLYLNEKQCTGQNDYGLFVLECFKADPECANKIIGGGDSNPINNGPNAIFTISKMSTQPVSGASPSGHWHVNQNSGAAGFQCRPNWIFTDTVQITALQLKTYLTTGTTGNLTIDNQLNNLNDPVNTSTGLYPNWYYGDQDFTTGAGQWQFNGNSFESPIITATDPIYGSYTWDQVFSNRIYLPTLGDSAAHCLVWECDALNPEDITNKPGNNCWGTPNSSGYGINGLTSNEIVNFIEVHCNPSNPWEQDPSVSFSDICFVRYTDFIEAANNEGLTNPSIPGINTDTIWTELITPDIVTIFPASSSCGCLDYTNTGLSSTTSTTVLTTSPTVNTSIPLGQGAQDVNYGKFGVKFHSDTTTSTFYNIPSTNTYFGSTSPNEGRLNNIGVWDGTNAWSGTNIIMNPLNEWIGFSRCINVPSDGDYLIGLGGDNRIRFAVNGETLIEKNTSDTSNFNYWWVYKVNLTAGNNTIVLEGKNDGSIASFGCDIVGPFPTGTFNSDQDFQNIEDNGVTLNGNVYTDLEDLYKNNIIFSSEDELGNANTDTCSDKTLVQKQNNQGLLVDGGVFANEYDAWSFITRDPNYDNTITGRTYWNTVNFTTLKAAVADPNGNIASRIGPDACTEIITYTVDSVPQTIQVVYIDFGYINGISITSNYPSLNNTTHDRHNNDPATYTNCSWNDIMTNDVAIAQYRSMHPSKFVNAQGITDGYYPNMSADTNNMLLGFGMNSLNPGKLTFTQFEGLTGCLCTTIPSGGEFNTQTNECPEGYLFNECTDLCEKLEESTITLGDSACPGMVINSNHIDGTFASSAEFIDYFTTYDNGFYGQNIDEHYFESTESLPFGTFVESECTGSNGLPIRRITGFKKDPSILPLDTTLYINYNTFLTQLNIDGHGVEINENSTFYSDLTSELIIIPQEGSCGDKTLITNPSTSDGSFPTPGSGNSGLVDFLEHYSDQGNNLQNIDVNALKFPIDPDSLTQTFQELCPVDADIYCFYDGTSMNKSTALNVMQTVENWVGEQGSNFTGNVYHMVSSHERWLDVARLPFTNIGDQLGNGGSGSISTIYSINDTVSSIQPQPSAASSDTTSGHTWYKVPLDGTNNGRAKQIKNMLWNDGETVVVNGITVNLKDVVNDGNGLYDDDHPNTTSGLSGTGNAWRGPAPSLVNATDKALCFNFYDESGQHGGSGQFDDQYHSFSNNTTPTFSHINCSKTKIEGTKQGKKHYRSDYELYVKTYLETVDRSDSDYQNQGDLIHVMYPSAPIGLTSGTNKTLGADGSTYFAYTQLAFPLHALGTILTGSVGENPGMLAPGHEILQPGASIAINFDALNGNAQTNTNAYCDSVWQNTSLQGIPTGYDSQYGYGGLQKYGWNITPESVKENPFTPIEFENTVNNIVESILCLDYEVTEYTDSNVCIDDDGNYIYHISNFYIDDQIDVSQTPFIKYTDYITYGQSLSQPITLSQTRLQTQIEGSIEALECMCAEPCPDTLVLNNNTTITIIGTSLIGTFNVGENIIQTNNTALNAKIVSSDPTTFTIVIEITSGTVSFEGDISGNASGAQLTAQYPNVKKVIGTSITDNFVQGEIINQTGNSTLNATIHRVSPHISDDFTLSINIIAGTLNSTGDITGNNGGILSGITNVSPFIEFEIPQPQGVFANYDDFLQFISIQSNGFTNIDLNTLKFQLSEQVIITETVESSDCSINADIFVFYDHTSMGATARENAFNAINDWVLDLEATQGYSKNVYHIQTNDERWVKWGKAAMEGLINYGGTFYPIEPHLAIAEADANVNVYSNTFASSNANFSTVGVPTGDILTICYLDEADSAYISGYQSGADALSPLFDPTEPKGGWQTDHTAYIAAYNNYTAGNIACFFYPTPAQAGYSSTAYSATMLGALAGITSGDNNNGLLANPPPSDHGGAGATDFNILKTENPYFTQGYGELDKYGWGTNVTFPTMTSEQLSTDLTQFVSTSDICEETTITEEIISVLCDGPSSTLLNPYGAFTVQGFYQNSQINSTSTVNQYNEDSAYYTSWDSFISTKLQEQGLAGDPFYNNGGANISNYTTFEQVNNSVEIGSTTPLSTTTTTYPLVNTFNQSIYNNSGLNTNITTYNLEDQVNEIQNISGDTSTVSQYVPLNNYWFNYLGVDNTTPPYNSCIGTNLPTIGAYANITSVSFNATGLNQSWSSATGTYNTWGELIDALNNSQTFTTTTPGSSTTTYSLDTQSLCYTGTDTLLVGNSGATVNANSEIIPQGSTVSGITTDQLDYIKTNDPSGNFDGYYFTDTSTGYTGTNCDDTNRYIYEIVLSHPGLDPGGYYPGFNAFASGFFASMQSFQQSYSLPYTSWDSFIAALNVSCAANGLQPQFFNNFSLQNVVDKMNNFAVAHPGYEGEAPKYDILIATNACNCIATTTSGPSSTTTTIGDDFDYLSTVNTINTFFNESQIQHLTINYDTATCSDVAGPPVTTTETEVVPGYFIPLVGEIDGGACECTSGTTGGDPLFGDIEYESCICCPESSSIEYGCKIGGEVSSSKCECTGPISTTTITEIPGEELQIIPSSSGKFIEFRIKPHRLDKPQITPIEDCCDEKITAITSSHLFSLYNATHPEVTPHLVLTPYSGSSISSSGDYRNWGSLELYKNGNIVASSRLFPAYNGEFWNVFIGTEGQHQSSSEVYFGAYQSNFLGHITHLTASATFTELERAQSFGDAAHNYLNNTYPAETAYFGGTPTTNNSSLGSVNAFFYTGSLQEIKYHTTEFLKHDILNKHALDPFQYAGNTVSSSWENVLLRLPLGSNNIIDSSSYNNNNTDIIRNFNPHPLTEIYPSSSISSSITNQAFEPVYEIHRHLTPDTVGISTTSEKVRIDSGSVDSSILSFNIKAENSTLDRQALDYNDLGVFFSPQKEINEDIVYTLGAFRMDDYIGDPKHQRLTEYPDLTELKLTYFQKYLNSHRQNIWDYVKLIQYIDHTLFKVIEQWVPAKANLKTGLLIEPHYLERTKFARQIPTIERLEKSASLNALPLPEGEVKHYEACLNISDLNNENYYQWVGSLTASDNLYMSQSKYASDECNPYITMYDNFDPLYGNFVNCKTSTEYYYVVKPYNVNIPIQQVLPNLNNVSPSRPVSTKGYIQALGNAQVQAGVKSTISSPSVGGTGGGGYSA